MDHHQLGRSGVRVSELCLGTMTFGREADEDASRAILDRFLDAGGNFVDTADGYGAHPGLSEQIVGRALAQRRDEVVLATKVRFPTGAGTNDRGLSRRHIQLGAESSLRNLGTDCIDLYQVHSWDPHTPLEETLGALDDLVHQGKVRYLGVSNLAAWQLAKALGLSALHRWQPVVSVQPAYSLITRDIEREILPLCISEGIAVLPYGPLAGGMLSGKYRPGEEPPADTRAGGDAMTSRGMSTRMNERGYAVVEAVRLAAEQLGRSPAQVALNWVGNRPGVTSPIIGARTVEQLTHNLGALGWRMDPEVEAALDEASRIRLGYPHEFHSWMAEIGF